MPTALTVPPRSRRLPIPPHRGFTAIVPTAAALARVSRFERDVAGPLGPPRPHSPYRQRRLSGGRGGVIAANASSLAMVCRTAPPLAEEAIGSVSEFEQWGDPFGSGPSMLFAASNSAGGRDRRPAPWFRRPIVRGALSGWAKPVSWLAPVRHFPFPRRLTRGRLDRCAGPGGWASADGR